MKTITTTPDKQEPAAEGRFAHLRQEAEDEDEEDFVLLLVEDYTRRLARKESPDACLYLAELQTEAQRQQFRDETLIDTVLGATL